MNPEAMEPFGKALRAFSRGERGAVLTVRRDDGHVSPLPAGHFFREQRQFTRLEAAALALCRGSVLDVGAGAGEHALLLRGEGREVTPIDISPQAVAIMKRRGLREARCVDVFDFRGGTFDTVLLLGHSIGMVGTIAGLDRFLAHVRGLVAPGGQILLDSLDVRVTDAPDNLAYHEANRSAGRYIGEIRMRFEFRNEAGPVFSWLQVDAETLSLRSAIAGWNCEVVHAEQNGEYLARLSRQRSA